MRCCQGWGRGVPIPHQVRGPPLYPILGLHPQNTKDYGDTPARPPHPLSRPLLAACDARPASEARARRRAAVLRDHRRGDGAANPSHSFVRKQAWDVAL
eukprot:gene16901-biopygen11901